MRMSVVAAAVGAALIGGQAGAVVLDINTSGSSPITVFAGTQQESHFDVIGCPETIFYSCPASVDLTEDVPMVATAGILRWTVVGTNDGSFNGPSTNFTFTTTYHFGGQSLSLTQSAFFRQIANEQFQLDVSDSDTATLDLGATGQLDLTALGYQVQLRPANSGGGAPIRTRFLLHDAAAAVPEPASWALMISGFGFTGAALRRRPHREARAAA